MPGHEMLGDEEFAEVEDVFKNGAVFFRRGFDVRRNGRYKVNEFEADFSKMVGSDFALAVSSGTAALRVALAALNIGSGDEVITQSFTFVATVEAIVESGAIPICTQIDSTLNMDPADLELKITPKTKAVIVVHMLGVPADLNRIVEICRSRNIWLIEDVAWGCGGSLGEKRLGSFGDVGCFSFDYAKTITTGEGGMIVTHSREIYERASAWHDHGHENNPNVQRWEDTRSGSGFNCRMMELQGAVGLAQLRKLDSIIENQRKNRNKISAALQGIMGLTPREMPPGSNDTADALIYFTKDRITARRCRSELMKVSIPTKILPEAYTWHFAGTWSHIPSLVAAHDGNLEAAFEESHSLLSRAFAIGIGVFQDPDAPVIINGAIRKALVEQ